MDFCDTWGELRQAVDGLKKKQLLQKPNLSSSVQQMAHLADKMRDEELGAHAGVCHCEAALMQAKMSESNEERKQWERAAAEMKAEEARHTNYHSKMTCPWTNDVSSCFLRAIKILMEHQCLKLAGMVSLEAAKHSLSCGNYTAGSEHAGRAVRLFEGERLCSADALKTLAMAQLKANQIELLLETLDQLWTLSMKAWRNSTPMGKELQKEADIATLLVICNRQPHPGRQTALRQSFETGFYFDDARFIRSPLDSPLNTSEALVLAAVTRAIAASQKRRAADLFARQAKSFLSPLCTEIFLWQLSLI